MRNRPPTVDFWPAGSYTAAMKPTVLLVNPPVVDFAAFDLFSKPLGLLMVAGELKARGVNVALLDAMDRADADVIRHGGPPVYRHDAAGKYVQAPIAKPTVLRQVPRYYYRFGMPAEIMEARLKVAGEQKPAAVLVTSGMTYWYPGLAETIQQVRRVMPGVPIILGGIYATLMPEHARRVCAPDVLCTGPEAMRQLDDALMRYDIAQASRTVRSEPVLPDYECYDHDLDYLTVLRSLGCPYRCGYCASGLLQPSFRQWPNDTVIDYCRRWLEQVRPHGGAKHLAFMDDALLAGDAENTLTFLDGLKALGPNVKFHCPNGLHARFITPDIARAMRAAGFGMIRLSYESAGAASVARGYSSEKITDEHFIRAVESLKAAGYHGGELDSYILVGLPGQDFHEVQDSVRAVYELGVRVRLSQFSPIPGTALFDAACRQAQIDADEPLMHNNSIVPGLDRQVDAGALQTLKNDIHRHNAALTAAARRA